MKLKDFLKMWKGGKDIEDVILVDTIKHQKSTDYLYHVLYMYDTADYGRHAALRVRVSLKDEVLEHDVMNIQGEFWGDKDAHLFRDRGANYTQAIGSWFSDWSNSTSTNVTINSVAGSYITYTGRSATSYKDLTTT